MAIWVSASYHQAVHFNRSDLDVCFRKTYRDAEQYLLTAGPRLAGDVGIWTEEPRELKQVDIWVENARPFVDTIAISMFLFFI